MAKDPAFLFYSSDFITGVQVLNMTDRGKYITLLCLMHQQGRLSGETISFVVGSVSVKLKSKFSIDENGLWYNKRLENETNRRNKFINSRSENGKRGGRPPKNPEKPLALATDNLPENENIDSIIRQLEAFEERQIPVELKLNYMYLVVEMMKTFIEANPDYFVEQQADYSACLDIAYKIATMKHWKKAEVIEGKMADCLASWQKIVEFIKNDEWFNSRTLSDISTTNEWQRLVQKMSNVKSPKEKKAVV